MLGAKESKGIERLTCTTRAHAVFPQEGVDAALADFAAIAGDANAAILRDYVAAVLCRAAAAGGAARSGKMAALVEADGDCAATGQAATDGEAAAAPAAAAAAAQPAAQPAAPMEVADREALFPREAAFTGAGANLPKGAAKADPAAAGGSTDDGAAAATGDGAAAAAGGGGKAAATNGGRRLAAPRPPRHALLQPMGEKQKRAAVHAFFKTEARLPAMRTETSQSASKEGSNTVRLPSNSIGSNSVGGQRCMGS